MPAIKIVNSKVNIKANVISNGLNIEGDDSIANLDVDYFTEELDPNNLNVGYELIHIYAGKVNIKSKVINYAIEISIQPTTITPINLNTQLNLKADKVFALEARGGQITLDIGEIKAIGLENCNVKGRINKISYSSNGSTTSFILGYPTLSNLINTLPYYIPFNNNPSLLNVNLHIDEIYTPIQVNQYVVGDVNLTGSSALSLNLQPGSNANVVLNYLDIGSNKFADRLLGTQVLNVLNLNSSIGSVKLINSFISNNPTDSEPIHLPFNSTKLTFVNCLIKQNSTITLDNINTRIFTTQTTDRDIYVLGQLITNKPINANHIIKYGTTIVDSSL